MAVFFAPAAFGSPRSTRGDKKDAGWAAPWALYRSAPYYRALNWDAMSQLYGPGGPMRRAIVSPGPTPLPPRRDSPGALRRSPDGAGGPLARGVPPTDTLWADPYGRLAISISHIVSNYLVATRLKILRPNRSRYSGHYMRYT